MSKTGTTIAIVGGGMVGISFALFLARCLPAVRVVLIEQHALPVSVNGALPSVPVLQPSFDARSTAISAGSVTLLQALGCWHLIEKHAAPIRSIHISDRGHYQGAQLAAEEYDVDALGYVVENSWLGQCLLYQMQHSAIECLAPAAVTHCDFKKTAAVLHLDHDEQAVLEADVVIVADGADSDLCKTMGVEYHKQEYQQSAMIANIGLANSHRGVAYERFTAQGPIALLPLTDCDNTHRAALVWTHPEHAIDDVMAMDDTQCLQQLQKMFGFRAGVFTDIGTRQAYPLTQCTACEQVRSRVIVAGNAAHFLHPVAGQGFNLSLRDGAVLADVLSTAQKSGEDIGQYRILQRYTAQREQDQSLTIALTHTMVKLFSSDNMAHSLVRQLGLMTLNAHTSIKNVFVQQMMGSL